MSLEEGQGASEEGAGALLLLVGQEFCIGEPRGVVDGDVQNLPADTAAAVHADMMAGDPMADAVDVAELLGVDVDQLAGVLAFVAHRGRPLVEGGETAEAEPAQYRADGGARRAEPAGDGRSAEPLPPERLDRGGRVRCQAMRAAARRRTAVAERLAGPVPGEPFEGAPLGDSRRNSRIGNPPALLNDPAHQQGSTVHRHPGMLVDVHPGLRARVGWLRNPSFSAMLRMNNPHSFDS